MSLIQEKNKEHIEWIESKGMKGKQLYLEMIDFRCTNDEDIRLDQARIIECYFDELNLHKKDYHLSTLCSSSFRYVKCYLCDFYRSDLSYTKFDYSELEKSNFSKCDFTEASLVSTKLIECKLINVLLYMTNLENAVLDTVDLSMSEFDETLVRGIRLKNIIGIETANFTSINIGSVDRPIYLFNNDAKSWICERITR